MIWFISLKDCFVFPKVICRFNTIHVRTNWQDDSKIHVKMQRTQNSQISLEKEPSVSTRASWFQNLLQSCSNQDSVILANDRPIDHWNRIEGWEITLRLVIDCFLTKLLRQFNCGKMAFRQVVLGQLDIQMEKEEFGSLPQHHIKNLTQNGP